MFSTDDNCIWTKLQVPRGEFDEHSNQNNQRNEIFLFIFSTSTANKLTQVPDVNDLYLPKLLSLSVEWITQIFPFIPNRNFLSDNITRIDNTNNKQS